MSDTVPVMQPTPAQLPIPQDTSFSGDNWARNLALLGGQMAQANNARFGAGFLANPGNSAIPIGIANSFAQANALDSQAATTQNTLAEAETKRLNNTLSAFSNDYYRQHPEMLFGTGVNPVTGVLNTSLTGQGVAGPMQGSTITTPAPGGYVIPQDRLQVMTGKAADSLASKGITIPAPLQTMFYTGIIPTESGGNTDPTLENPRSIGSDPKNKAFGVAGLLPSTVRKPGYGMEPGDVEALRKDPQGQMAFALEYAYRRATAPADQGGLGMTPEDFNNPGMLAHVAALYGGATTPEGHAAYVGQVAGHMLSSTGRTALSSNPDAQLQQAMSNNGVQPRPAWANPPSSTEQQLREAATVRQLQNPQPSAQPSVQDQHSTYNSVTQKWEADPNQPAASTAPSVDTTPTYGQTRPVTSDLEGSLPTPPQKPLGTPVTATEPVTPPSYAPDSLAAQRALREANTPRTPQTEGPIVANSGAEPTPAQTQSQTQPAGQTAVGMPPNLQTAIETLTAQSQAAFAQADQFRRQATAVVRFNPGLATQFDQRAQAAQARGQAAQSEAMKIFGDYQTERAKTGTWEPATQNGVAGNINSVTHEFKPLTPGTGRLSQMADGSLWESPVGGGPPHMVAPANNPGVAAKHAAEAQGTATGTESAKLVPKLVTMAQTSANNIANIDVGLAAAQRAAKEGINSGFFAPWLATAAAMAKSAGFKEDRIPGLNVDPKAVSDVQVAQKTLTVVGGQILQNVLGDAQITEGKINAFIHTQPGIETDPNAMDRILAWARTQHMYNLQMAMSGLKAVDPKTGMLSPGWQPSYIAQNGAGPIYDPLADEGAGGTVQPNGKGPAAEPPKRQPDVVYQEGQTATGPNGQKLIFHDGKWK